MTLELARKRRSQSDLIDELVGALRRLIPVAEALWEEEEVKLKHGEIFYSLKQARAVLEKAKEHDYIPIDDAAEVAQDGTRW